MKKRPRIAVMLPVEYRGGTLHAAKMVAQAIWLGSKQAGESVDVVLAHLDHPNYSDDDFEGLPSEIKRRPFRWKYLDNTQAKRAAIFAGSEITGETDFFQYPDDGMQEFLDCDFIVFLSDRLERPILPQYRYAMIVYDYIQRYVKFLPAIGNNAFTAAARAAAGIFTTTQFTARDATQFAGVPPERITVLPPLVPVVAPRPVKEPESYFVWPTNLAIHKNQSKALEAISFYYEKGGALDCIVTGPRSNELPSADWPHLKRLQSILSTDKELSERVRFMGDIPERAYRSLVAKAQFVFHPVIVDNGTFSVIEAAMMGVPSASADYPAMRELCATTGVEPVWFDPHNSIDMGGKLLQIEKERATWADRMKHNIAHEFTPQLQALPYWSAVKAIMSEARQPA